MHMTVFSHSLKITVFPLLAPFLCRVSNLPIYFFLLFSTPIRHNSRIIPFPRKKYISSISVSKIYWPIHGIPSWQSAFKIYLQTFNFNFFTSELAGLCCSNPRPSPKLLEGQSCLDCNDLHGRMLSWPRTILFLINNGICSIPISFLS